MKKQIYKVDSKGYITGIYLGEFDEDGKLISPSGNFITVDLPQPLLLIKPKWTGTKWAEGATQDEIEEHTKVVPQPPTEIEELTNYVLDVDFRLIMIEMELL